MHRPAANHDDDKLFQRPFTVTEVFDVIKNIAAGKTPGPHGLTAEFYLHCWQTIAQDFTAALNDMHTSGDIPTDMKTVFFKLIHKKGTQTDLRNYHPVTLLNTDLKIYTKLISNRIRSYLTDVISPQQYAAPGGSTFQASTLLRDLHQHVSAKK